MIDEQPVPQVDDDAETAITTPPQPPAHLRAATQGEWPPAPPPPADAGITGVEVDDETTSLDAVPPGRHATVYSAVVRPPTEPAS